ncbi:hypothetical protein C8R46DRAFT_1194181 [Mycena filopes]|nr:hypothetical protein C8R46DRAFT_1194176 [Mycena filopes]KAJ7161696.1 hypothetical protein C8R46DRAFT_1194181 [Mycena filopes]
MTSLARILCAPLPSPPPPYVHESVWASWCAHVFEYAGASPFQDLANLVARYAPCCTGYNKNGATLQCEPEWEPFEKVFEGILHPTTEMYHNFGGVANDSIQDLAYNEPPQPVSYEDSDTENDDTPTAVAQQPRRPAQEQQTQGQKDPSGRLASAPSASPSRNPHRSRRRARTRRRSGARICTATPGPRRCTRTTSSAADASAIKLDSRRRYYPGLWEVHRGHCVEVQAGLLQENRPIEVEVPVVVEDPMAPRKPYYREHA